MVSTSTTNPGITNLFKGLFSGGSSKSSSTITYDQRRASQKKAWQDAYANKASSTPSQNGDGSASSSSGSGITTMDDAAADVYGDANGLEGSEDGATDGSESDSGSGSVSPLLQGEITFEELIGNICNGIDLIFATKRTTVVITDYEGIYAEAKYLRDLHHKSVQSEDLSLWQLEEGTYELDVSEYGFYNTVNVHYKNGVVTESYEDLVKVYGVCKIDYYEKSIDKTTAQMKAKAYLAAHVRDFDMSVKANILWDGDIDVGDIVTLENPLTMRDKKRVEVEKRDPEYFFVVGKSIEWEGDGPITGSLELRYGAVSPEEKDVPEAGTGYSDSSSSSSASSGDIDTAVDEVGKLAAKISYSGACQTHDCVKSKQTGDCFGMSDFIGCELISRGVSIQIKGYPTSYAPEHRSVLYKDSKGQWTRFPYRKYGVSYLFRDTDAVTSGHNVNCTCG